MQKTPFYKRFAGSFVLAVCLLQSASYVDAAQDLNEVRKMAEQGDAEAQFTLGQMYDSGDGVAQNYKQAAAWYRKAAEQGNDSAQNFLGGS
jgi:TPR repeat protein